MIGRNRSKYTFSDGYAGTTKETKEWNQRLDSTQHILEHIEYFSKEIDTTKDLYGYVVTGVPVGLLVIEPLRNSNELKPCALIWYLVTHPGSATAGVILVEFAANYAESHNLKGAMGLHSLNQDSTKFYQSLGFCEVGKGEGDDGPIMFLAPQDSNEWTKQGGVWRVKRYMGQGQYLGGQGTGSNAYRWQNAPPIVKIDKSKRAAKTMMSNVSDWRLPE